MKKLMVCMTVALLAVPVMAEPQRPLLTLENKFPEQNQVEVGTLLSLVEIVDNNEFAGIGDRDERTLEAYVRYGVTENMALVAGLPYMEVEPDMGDSESGASDASLGVQLKVFEDIFSYPWVIPHARVRFDNGDEDKGLGAGEMGYEVGVSLGTTVDPSWDWIDGFGRWGFKNVYHFIADASYEINENSENITTVAGTVIWEASDKLGLLLEGYITDEELEPDDGHPSYFQAGFAYQATDSFAINFYGGGAKNTDEDVRVTLKLSYTF
ncbi:MAG: hypothetical protein AB7T27_07300 [Kiritimatiellia bacterium]